MSETVENLIKEFHIGKDDWDEVAGHDDLYILYASTRQDYEGLVDKANKLGVIDSFDTKEHKVIVRSRP